MRFFLLFIVICLLDLSCRYESENNNKYKRFYSNDGVLRKEGFFNSDMKPIDTIKIYSENGKLKSIEVYDSSGILDGNSITYYRNGMIEQKRNFSKGMLNGWIYNFYETGKLKSTGYAMNNNYIGDRIHYYENGKIKAYNFLDFYEHNYIVQLFDSISEARFKNIGDKIVIDSIVYQGDSIHLKFLLAHPPFSKNEIVFEKINYQNEMIYRERIPDSANLFNIDFLKDSNLKSALLRIEQLDSLSGKINEYNNRYDFYQ